MSWTPILPSPGPGSPMQALGVWGVCVVGEEQLYHHCLYDLKVVIIEL